MAKKYKIQICHNSEELNQIFSLVGHGQKASFLERATINYIDFLLKNNQETLNIIISDVEKLKKVLKITEGKIKEEEILDKNFEIVKNTEEISESKRNISM